MSKIKLQGYQGTAASYRPECLRCLQACHTATRTMCCGSRNVRPIKKTMIDFESLPTLVQKRFAELADLRTLSLLQRHSSSIEVHLPKKRYIIINSLCVDPRQMRESHLWIDHSRVFVNPSVPESFSQLSDIVINKTVSLTDVPAAFIQKNLIDKGFCFYVHFLSVLRCELTADELRYLFGHRQVSKANLQKVVLSPQPPFEHIVSYLASCTHVVLDLPGYVYPRNWIKYFLRRPIPVLFLSFVIVGANFDIDHHDLDKFIRTCMHAHGEFILRTDVTGLRKNRKLIFNAITDHFKPVFTRVPYNKFREMSGIDRFQLSVTVKHNDIRNLYFGNDRMIDVRARTDDRRRRYKPY